MPGSRHGDDTSAGGDGDPGSDDLVIAGSYQVGLVAVKVTRNGENFQAELAWTRKAAPRSVAGFTNL